MKPVRIKDDIVPIAEFKTHASRIMRRLKAEGRPIVITQRGKAAAVLVPAADFDRLMERERFVAAVEQGLAESKARLAVESSGDLNDLLDERFGVVDDA